MKSKDKSPACSHVWWWGFGLLWFVTIAIIWLLLQTTANHLHVYSSDEVLLAARRDDALYDLKHCPVSHAEKAEIADHAVKCSPAKYFYNLRDALVNVADRSNAVTMVTEVNDINVILDFFKNSVVQNTLCNSMFVIAGDEWLGQLSVCGVTALVTQLSTQELATQVTNMDYSALFVHPSVRFHENPFAWFDCGYDCDVMIHPSAHVQSNPVIMYVKASNTKNVSKEVKIRHFPQENFCSKPQNKHSSGCVVVL